MAAGQRFLIVTSKMMQPLTLQTYNPVEINKLAAFFESYLNRYPDAKLMPPEFYTYHPALKDSENVFCVLTDQQKMMGFAPVFPVITTNKNGVTGPHEIWVVILAVGELEMAVSIHELLFQAVVARANSLKAEYGLAKVKLAADMMVSQQADIDFLLQKGFMPFEQIHVMRFETTQASPTIAAPPGISFQQTKLATADEQAAYLVVEPGSFTTNSMSGILYPTEQPTACMIIKQLTVTVSHLVKQVALKAGNKESPSPLSV